MPGSIRVRIEQARREGRKQVAVLIDPDKIDRLTTVVENANIFGVDLFFVGGSILHTDQLDKTIRTIKSISDIPVVLFPGSINQISPLADAILLLSLISGRNPEYLIGAHVSAAPMLVSSGLEILSTSYLLIDGGKPTTVSYISNTAPIPSDKPDIAAITALAGEMIGHSLTYLDAGSGAASPVSPDMIRMVRKSISNPIIVGGGIRSAEQLAEAFEAGADIAVIGNAFEENPQLMNMLRASAE